MASSKPRIGLVLASVPAYSETFFTTKINGLAAQGYSFLLFARGEKPATLLCRHISPYPVVENRLLRILYFIVIISIVLLRAPARVARFWRLEKQDGLGLTQILKSIYLNAHILPYRLSWLHMGFAAVGLGRENVAQAMGAKLAVSFRGFDLNVYPLKHKACYNRLWTKVTKVHSISNHLVERAYLLGLSKSVAVDIIPPAVAHDLPIKSTYEFQNPLQLVTVARLTWIKGLPYALQAVAQLKAAGIPVHYTIVGDGPDREYLLHEIHELQLTHEVTLLGKLDHSKTLERIQLADIYLQPSLNEGFCNAVLEAQAIGCLCVASRVGGLVENIQHEATGWLVKPRSASELAEIIIQISELPLAERKRLSNNARKHAAQFNKAAHIEKWKVFYTY